jgi:hypothetical protein
LSKNVGSGQREPPGLSVKFEYRIWDSFIPFIIGLSDNGVLPVDCSFKKETPFAFGTGENEQFNILASKSPYKTALSLRNGLAIAIY